MVGGLDIPQLSSLKVYWADSRPEKLRFVDYELKLMVFEKLFL